MKEFEFEPGMALEEELANFLKNVVNSMAKLDLINFFFSNPYTIDTVDGLALRIGRRVEGIEKTVEELSEAGILEKRVQGELVLYAFVPGNKWYELIERLLKSLDTRETRLKIITYIIKLEGLT